MTLAESFTQAASVFRSRSFLIFLGLYLFGQGGMDFISGMAVYYVQHALGAYPAYYIPILAVLMVAQLVGMLIFGPVMSKTSKKLAIVIAAPLRLVGVLGLLAFSHHGAPLVPILALASLIGLGNAGSMTENEKIPRVKAWCAEENIGSQKVLKKAGMQLIQIEKGGLVVGDRIYDRLIHEYRLNKQAVFQ